MSKRTRSIRQLHWLSSYSRKILLARLALRNICVLHFRSGKKEHSDFGNESRTRMVLLTVQSLIRSLALNKEGSRLLVAPVYREKYPPATALKQPKIGFKFEVQILTGDSVVMFLTRNSSVTASSGDDKIPSGNLAVELFAQETATGHLDLLTF